MEVVMTGIPPTMRLGCLLQEWLDTHADGETAKADPVSGVSEYETTNTIGGQPYAARLSTHESTQWIRLQLRTPWQVPEERHGDACRLVNEINRSIAVGRLIAQAGGPFELEIVTDIEGCEPSPLVVTNMTRAGDYALRRYGLALARIAFNPVVDVATLLAEASSEHDQVLGVDLVEESGCDSLPAML